MSDCGLSKKVEKRLQVSIELAALLSNARRKSKMTQPQAAEKLGLYRLAIARLETGDRKTTVSELGRIAELYGVPVETFTKALEE